MWCETLLFLDGRNELLISMYVTSLTAALCKYNEIQKTFTSVQLFSENNTKLDILRPGYLSYLYH